MRHGIPVLLPLTNLFSVKLSLPCEVCSPRARDSAQAGISGRHRVTAIQILEGKRQDGDQPQARGTSQRGSSHRQRAARKADVDDRHQAGLRLRAAADLRPESSQRRPRRPPPRRGGRSAPRLLWLDLIQVVAWVVLMLAVHARMYLFCRQFARTADRRCPPSECGRGGSSRRSSSAASPGRRCFMLVPAEIGSQDGIDIFLFATALIAVSATTMLASTIPAAAVAGTIPVTLTLADRLSHPRRVSIRSAGDHGSRRAVLLPDPGLPALFGDPDDARVSRREGPADRRTRHGQGDLGRSRGVAPRRPIWRSPASSRR